MTADEAEELDRIAKKCLDDLVAYAASRAQYNVQMHDEYWRARGFASREEEEAATRRAREEQDANKNRPDEFRVLGGEVLNHMRSFFKDSILGGQAGRGGANQPVRQPIRKPF